MAKRWFAFLLGIVLLAMQSGCLTHLAIPLQIPLQGTASYRAIYAATAMDASGAMHIVHTECEITAGKPCFLFYRKVKFGAVLETRLWTPPAGGSYSYPDIAVTNDGTAYITWWYENSAHEYYDLWTRADSSEAPWFIDGSYRSNGPPIVETNGSVVFVLYKVVDGTGTAYRYKRITPGDPVGGWVSPHGDNVRRTAGDAAVGPDNKFYVTWAVYNSGVNSIYYNDNHNAAGNMINTKTIVFEKSVSGATIDVSDVSSTPYIFMLYLDFEPDAHPASHDLRLVICDDGDYCASRLDHPLFLPSSEHWAVGGYVLDAVGNRAHVAFSAVKDGLSRSQVFVTGYKTNEGDLPMEQITTGDINAYSPSLIAFGLGLDDILVLTFQRDIGSCEYNLYEYDTVNQEEILLDQYIFGYADMAVNTAGGDIYLGAVWVAPNILEGDGRWATFFTYNDVPIFLPFIRR